MGEKIVHDLSKECKIINGVISVIIWNECKMINGVIFVIIWIRDEVSKLQKN